MPNSTSSGDRPTDEWPVHVPLISEVAAQSLRAYAFDLRGADAPPYGTPLLEIVALLPPSQDWLEGAVLAGYIPTLMGIELAVRGVHAFICEQIASDERAGATGDAIEWASFSDAYRIFIGLLGQLARELEREAERLRPAPDPATG